MQDARQEKKKLTAQAHANAEPEYFMISACKYKKKKGFCNTDVQTAFHDL